MAPPVVSHRGCLKARAFSTSRASPPGPLSLSLSLSLSLDGSAVGAAGAHVIGLLKLEERCKQWYSFSETELRHHFESLGAEIAARCGEIAAAGGDDDGAGEWGLCGVGGWALCVHPRTHTVARHGSRLLLHGQQSACHHGGSTTASCSDTTLLTLASFILIATLFPH
jgi:hypothetical protein